MATLLIVEDDKQTNEAICEYLKSAGHKIVPAFDGLEALKIFEQENIDLVVLDIMLPKITGLGVLHELRKKSSVPIIMLTAIEDEYTQVTSFDEQADDYITKPFSMVLLGRSYGGILIAYSIEYRKELSNMKKSIITPLAAVLCLSLLTGCNAKDSSTPPDSQQTNPPAQATVASANISDTSEAYEKLVALKTEDYKQQSVADFNQSLAPNNGDISGLLDAQADVLASISPDDKNYEFITVTLAASLDELYCEQMNDSVGLSAYLKKEEQPLEKLPGEESVAGAEITYQFVFNALYRLNYTFSDPTQITVAERDSALQKFKTEFQNYVDNLSEADLASSNIKTVLSEKADELENSLSTAKMKLSCEVENVEVHNAGEEIVNN